MNLSRCVYSFYIKEVAQSERAKSVCVRASERDRPSQEERKEGKTEERQRKRKRRKIHRDRERDRGGGEKERELRRDREHTKVEGDRAPVGYHTQPRRGPSEQVNEPYESSLASSTRAQRGTQGPTIGIRRECSLGTLQISIRGTDLAEIRRDEEARERVRACPSASAFHGRTRCVRGTGTSKEIERAERA